MLTVLERIVENALESKKKRAIIQAGHFPLVYENGAVSEGVLAWGLFSTITFRIGCEAAVMLQDAGVDAKLAIICDDHSGEQAYNALRSTTDLPRWRLARSRFFRNASGDDPKLNELYKQLLRSHGLNESRILRHDHRKPGRRDCVYFSENVLRQGSGQLFDACSREYEQFLAGQADAHTYLIGFVPLRCHHFIQDVLHFVHTSEHTHLYLPTPLGQSTTVAIIDERKGRAYTSEQQEITL